MAVPFSIAHTQGVEAVTPEHHIAASMIRRRFPGLECVIFEAGDEFVSLCKADGYDRYRLSRDWKREIYGDGKWTLTPTDEPPPDQGPPIGMPDVMH